VEPQDKKDHLMSGSSTGSPSTRYGTSGIEDGSVMTRLATGSTTDNPMKKKHNAVHSYGGEIHEMDESSRENIHELASPRGLHEMPADDKRLGSPFSVEKY